jgi:hypothetical protein
VVWIAGLVAVLGAVGTLVAAIRSGRRAAPKMAISSACPAHTAGQRQLGYAAPLQRVRAGTFTYDLDT